MSQHHEFQEGLFLVTTNTKGRIPWLTLLGVPEQLIRNLFFARDLYGAYLYAFCILPNHMHIILYPGLRGVSKFMQSFKTNSMRHIHELFSTAESTCSPLSKGEICWQKGFDARLLSGERAISHAFSYVHFNAAKHEIVEDGSDWPWTSLHFEGQMDCMEW